MLVQRDKKILIFIEQFGSISIYQCAKIFFSQANQSRDLARKRLRKLYDMGLLKYYTNPLSNERMYCVDKKISPHTTFLLDVYASFVESGANILEFYKEPQWLDGKYRSDGFFLVEYNGKKRICCVEVDVTHTTDLNKYQEIYDSNIFQDKFGIFPLIIIVGEEIYPNNIDSFDIVFLDYKLNKFVEKVLAL
jgi:hypothetical protein